MKLLYLIFLTLFFSAKPSLADVYQCEDKNGNITFQDRICAGKSKQSTLNLPTQDPKDKWELIDETDDMTNKKVCVISSPQTYVGKQGSDFLFSTIRITKSSSGNYIVGLYSHLAFDYDREPPPFHHNIQGVGIKIDQNSFITADTQASQRVIGFEVEKSKIIISELSNGNSASVRVRFWPYDYTLDGKNIQLWDFNRALQDLDSCSNRS